MVMRRHDRERFGAKIPGKRKPKQFELVEEAVVAENPVPKWMSFSGKVLWIDDAWASMMRPPQTRRVIREKRPEPQLTKAERKVQQGYGQW